ncbi:MAG: T9SS type A sorting domain-containing protein [Flammeovirgaceae bacterium]|nr:T9SS type A sorting domain-containing protein [Flammeovirgaceae bacterium]
MNDKLGKENFSVYPNPFESQLVISHHNSIKFYHFEIYSIDGHLIYSEQNPIQGDYSINFSYLHKGFYILRIIHGESILEKKLFKK